MEAQRSYSGAGTSDFRSVRTCYNVIHWLLTKFVRSRWRPDIRQVLFCMFMVDRDEDLVYKHTEKERGQYPAILTK